MLIKLLISLLPIVTCFHTPAPAYSPATGLNNELYEWKNGQKIRYQVAGSGEKTALLVHGLFVNSDHWRKTLQFLAENGYRAYAIDLLGSGYSSKPPRDSMEAKLLCGESRRNVERLKQVSLGTASGGTRTADVELRHPLQSCYNFYTWADQIMDFTRDVIKSDTTLVCNSIGTISSFQAVIDDPELFDGVFVVNPNYRELHVSEQLFPNLAMPVLRTIQKLLREKGHGLFKSLAKPDTVRQILKEPYHVTEAVDDTLVQVLLDPLLTQGAADVVFDTLSYSAGPLPEQQLQDSSFTKPIWVCYGKQDPWTPSKRVEILRTFNTRCVEQIFAIDGAGHCPHDEAPEIVNPLLLEFLQRVKLEPISTEKIIESSV